jgi:hypothetical protein
MVTNIEYCSKHIKSFHAFETTVKEKKNELLELCVGDEKKKGPIETAKPLEASLEHEKKT